MCNFDKRQVAQEHTSCLLIKKRTEHAMEMMHALFPVSYTHLTLPTILLV